MSQDLNQPTSVSRDGDTNLETPTRERTEEVFDAAITDVTRDREEYHGPDHDEEGPPRLRAILGLFGAVTTGDRALGGGRRSTNVTTDPSVAHGRTSTYADRIAATRLNTEDSDGGENQNDDELDGEFPRDDGEDEEDDDEASTVAPVLDPATSAAAAAEAQEAADEALRARHRLAWSKTDVPPAVAPAISAETVRGYKLGSFVDLFDKLGRKLAFANASTEPIGNYNNVREATTVFEAVFDKPARAALKKDATDFLSQRHTGKRWSAEAVAASLFPRKDDAALEKAIFVRRLLETKWSWNKSLSWGDLLVSAFVILCSLKDQHETRDAFNVWDARLTTASGWTTIKNNFCNEFVAFMLGSMLQGPYYSPKNALSVADQDNKGPLYYFVIIPVLKMAKGLFPGEFSYEFVLHTKVPLFVRNQKQRFGPYGVYSSQHLDTFITVNPAEVTDLPFLLGGFYDHLRALTLVNTCFNLDAKNGFNIKEDDFNCTDEETASVAKGYVMGPPWILSKNRTEPLRFEANAWYPDAKKMESKKSGTKRRRGSRKSAPAAIFNSV